VEQFVSQETLQESHLQDEDLQPADIFKGLTEDEVMARRKRGLGNNVRIDTSRTYTQILQQNVFTFINSVLFAIGILMVLLGLYGDAMVSVAVVMMNVVVGVVQEFRAKHKLDRIALLTRPKVGVIRDGEEQVIDPGEIVVGDVLVVRSGDQIVVDGTVVGDGKMEVDESLLTGESDLITKQAGDQVLSGSFCVTGSAWYTAEKVGLESFANKLTARARVFRVVRTPLERNINFVVRMLLLLATVIGLLFAASYAIRQVPTIQSVQSAAVIAGLVPTGLILMTTTAYAMGALRMSGRGALIQKSNAVESMSNVTVLCLDKTGTLTANRIHLHDTHALEGDDDEFRRTLGDYARTTRAGNRTSDALLEECGGQARQVIDEIPFSSARKWSALSFDDAQRRGVYVLGAPEILQAYLPEDADIGQEQIDAWVNEGLRVLLMVYSPEPVPLHDENENPRLPDGLQPFGLVSFSDELRPEARETIAGFVEAGIGLKIISGDNPYTVAAVAKQAGLPGEIKTISGRELAEMDKAQIAQIAEEVNIFGRITPDQKELLVDLLRDKGYYVAMIGDGVNDVLSLKKAQIGIAMQSGSAATRGVADIVLLNDSFAALPAAFMEGQRILNGMEDIMKLFLTRAFYAALIILGTAVVAEAQLFPFVPKHAALLTLLTVGLPTFALAAWARVGVPRHNLIRSVMHFIFPAALTIAATALAVYSYYLINWYIPAPPGAEEIQAVNISRTALTTVVVFMGLLLVPFVEPPTPRWVGGDELSGDWRPTVLALVMLGIFVTIKLVEPLRVFFELALLQVTDYLFLITVAILWAIVQRYIWRLHLFERFLGLQDTSRTS
jgi:cation-transporting P-type ATPase E